MTYTFLHEPPPGIKQLFIDSYGPSYMTKFTLTDGTVEQYDIIGELSEQWFINNNFFDGSGSSRHWNKQIAKIEFGDHVASIGSGACSWNFQLNEVIIPDSVTAINDSAFMHCAYLSAVSIGSGISSIGDAAFNDIGRSSFQANAFRISEPTPPDDPNSKHGTMNEEDYTFGSGTSRPIITIAKTRAYVENMNPYDWFYLIGCDYFSAKIICIDGNLISYYVSA